MQDSERATEWLLDGFNVLHAALFSDRDRSTWWAEEHRERLIARVCEFSEPADAIWIVFDGERSSEPDARQLRTAAGIPVYLVFAPSADDWLVKRVRAAKQNASGSERSHENGVPGEAPALAVVTRDKRVGGRARHHGATVVTPGRFLEFCRAD